MSALVKINGVHKSFTRGSERIDVLKGVTLDIPQGDFLALMGPSGSGKTTLLNLLGGLDAPTSGSIEIGGTNIGGLSGGQLSRWRSHHIGFVFQLYNLLPVMRAPPRSEEHTSELQSRLQLVCRLLLEKKNRPWARIH